jgi:hypothetical protein
MAWECWKRLEASARTAAAAAAATFGVDMVIVVAVVVMKDGIECGGGRRDNNNDGGVADVRAWVGVVLRAADVYWNFDGLRAFAPAHCRCWVAGADFAGAVLHLQFSIVH